MPQTSTTLHHWNSWVKSQELGSLYQTSIWAHFQEQIPGKERPQLITVTDPENNTIMGGGFLIQHTLPFSMSWLECPRGPVFDTALTPEQLEYFFKEFLKKAQEIAKKSRAIFLRIDPPVTQSPTQDHNTLHHAYESISQELHLKKAHASYFPQTTLLLDLALSEEEILKQMKPKGRYNIKVAQKHGVYIEKVSKDHLKEFYQLIEQTAERDNFSIHNPHYYKTMLDTLGDASALWMAYHASASERSPIPLAGLIATYWGTTATYYYCGSSYEHRNMMAPYLLQWKVMQDAKAHGCTTYDLLGVAPPDAKNHPWQGVTDFKTKFGGNLISYSHAKEFVFKPVWYFLMLLRKKARS